MIHESDRQFPNFAKALFTPTDMSDYEETYLSWNEAVGALPLEKANRLAWIRPENHPQSDALIAMETMEAPPRWGTSQTFKGLIDAHYADPEEEEMEFYGSEGDEDEEYGDEEEEGGEEDYGDYDEEDPDEVWPPAEKIKHLPLEDRMFPKGAPLREKYNEIELDSFMKLLGVKPRVQWQDEHGYFNKMAVHNYEDEAQEIDPDYHLLAESERKAMDRQQTK